MVHTRRAVRSFVRSCGFSESDVNDVVVAVGEAMANAVEHAGASTVSVRCRFDGGVLVVDVSDDGLGFPEWSDVVAAADRSPRETTMRRHRGFGIRLMRELMDDVAFADDGRCVSMTKRRRA
jgi:anti-sigma regulatory factor (Ser/Thr protein kinase)